KGSPKGRVSILSPLELPLSFQRLCLWKLREAPALVLFHAQAQPVREAGAQGKLSRLKWYEKHSVSQ
ncbi:hypothetical protein, partial [Faecalispora jeddahensis]|uniref:hypothetical protein n=1 Tax=Faecalispora jeddahensis TaxID=1414721 RepID=UPI0028A65E70